MIRDQAVAVLHQDVAQVAELCILAAVLALQPGFRVRLRGVGVVAALLPIEAPLAAVPGSVSGTTAVLGSIPLYQGLGLYQAVVYPR